MEPKLLTVRQSAALLGLSRSSTYALVTKGEICSLKIGRSRRVPVLALDEFIRKQLETRD